MKFQVRYPGAAPHDVELQGTVAVVGRDPSSDIVLSDSKCSRRHAVLEAGPQGIAIRDAGSANGVFVNDKKVERAALSEGDVIRLGDVELKVLPEEMPGTLMMEPDEMEEDVADAPPPLASVPGPPPPSVTAPPASASRRPAEAVPPAPRPRPEPRPRPVASRALVPERPLTVAILSGLWLASVLLYGLGGVLTAHSLGWTGVWAALPIAAGAILALVSAAMAYGLWALAPWARVLQIVLAAFGVFLCPFTLASVAVLFYMSRPAARAAFSGRRPQGRAAEDAVPVDTSKEPAFAAVVLGTVLLGVLASGSTLLLGRGGGGMEEARTAAREEAAVTRLRKLAAAQVEFQSATCANAFADLDGLLNPRSAIPDYRPDGPAFLPPEFARAEALGYRFGLSVEEPVLAEGCAARGYRRFAYTATPVEPGGRHLIVGPDGVVHAAAGRPATPEDPAVR